MSTISASDVMKLRERTGAGMMECKKYLTDANGDIELAIIDMRKSGQAKANKKADRIAAEGVIVIARSADGKYAIILEINSETDFVARDSNFTAFAEKVGKTAVANSNIQDVEALAKEKLADSSQTVEEARLELISKIGENIKLRRISCLRSADGCVGAYLHGKRIGVLVSISSADEALAKDIAMHVAASNPMVVSRKDVPQDAIEKEREIYAAQAKESGKPQDIIDKMVEGRIGKFLDEVSLCDQYFVKDPNKKIEQLLKEKNTEVSAFIRFEVGEGIEKKEDNFVEEVMAQVRG